MTTTSGASPLFVQHVKNSFIPYVGTVSVKLFPSLPITMTSYKYTLIWAQTSLLFGLLGRFSLIARQCKMKNLLKMKNLYCCRVGVISLLRCREERRFEERFIPSPLASEGFRCAEGGMAEACSDGYFRVIYCIYVVVEDRRRWIVGPYAQVTVVSRGDGIALMMIRRMGEQ